MHFTVTLAGLKNIVRYIEEFVKQRFVKLWFHCNEYLSLSNGPRLNPGLGNPGEGSYFPMKVTGVLVGNFRDHP